MSGMQVLRAVIAFSLAFLAAFLVRTLLFAYAFQQDVRVAELAQALSDAIQPEWLAVSKGAQLLSLVLAWWSAGPSNLLPLTVLWAGWARLPQLMLRSKLFALSLDATALLLWADVVSFFVALVVFCGVIEREEAFEILLTYATRKGSVWRKTVLIVITTLASALITGTLSYCMDKFYLYHVYATGFGHSMNARRGRSITDFDLYSHVASLLLQSGCISCTYVLYYPKRSIRRFVSICTLGFLGMVIQTGLELGNLHEISLEASFVLAVSQTTKTAICAAITAYVMGP